MRKQRGDEVRVYVFDLVTEFVVEVRRAQYNLFAEEALLDASGVGAGKLGADGMNAILIHSGLAAVVEQEGIERAELVVDRRFFDAPGEVEVDLRSVKFALAGTDRVVDDSDARRAFGSVELVLLDASAERVEDALLEIAIHLQHVVVVAALEVFAEVVDPFVFGSALVFVAEASDYGEVRRDAVIGLCVEIVAVRYQVNGVRVDAAVVHQGLAGRGISICPFDSYKIAVVVAINGISGSVVLAGFFPFAGQAIANERVPCVAESMVDGCGKEDILVGLLASVGHAVEGIRAGQTGGDVRAARGDANGCGAAEGVAQIRDRGDVVVLVQRDGVTGLEVPEGSVVIEFAVRSAKLNLIPVRTEGARVTLVEKRWKGRCSARRKKGERTGCGIGAPEHAVRSAICFHMRNAGAGDSGQIETAADVFDGNVVEQDLVVVRVASPDEDRGDAAPLAGLDNVKTRNLAKRINHNRAIEEVVFRDHGD